MVSQPEIANTNLEPVKETLVDVDKFFFMKDSDACTRLYAFD